MTTTLVTGAGGFIGKPLAARLRERGDATVIALQRSDVALETLDRDYWTQRGVTSIDHVLHFGAYTPKDASSADVAAPIVASNVDGTAALLRSLPNVPRQVLFASSLDVYQRVPGQTIDERSAIGPATLYGASKFFGEELVRNYARANGCAYCVLRIGHVYGPGEERYKRVIPSLIRSMLAGGVPVLSGDGSALRDFLYVDDAVDAVLAAAELSENADAVNVVRGESITLLDLATEIAALTGYRGEFGFSGSNGDSLRFDNRVMKERLGIRSFVPFRDGLAREVAHFRQTES